MRNLLRLSSATIIIAMLATLYGCGAEPPKPSTENVKATAALGALEAMRSAYVARDMDGVLSHVSPSLAGGYSEFAKSMRKDTETYKGVELKLFIERVELAAGEARVVFHWHGKWSGAAGGEAEGRGNSVFSFSDDEKMQLIRIVGDTPFGVVR